MMTRQEYIGLADALAAGCVKGDIISKLLVFLRRNNPRFDEARFVAYLEKRIDEERKL